jgi:hypothetical protein
MVRSPMQILVMLGLNARSSLLIVGLLVDLVLHLFGLCGVVVLLTFALQLDLFLLFQFSFHGFGQTYLFGLG